MRLDRLHASQTVLVSVFDFPASFPTLWILCKELWPLKEEIIATGDSRIASLQQFSNFFRLHIC